MFKVSVHSGTYHRGLTRSACIIRSDWPHAFSAYHIQTNPVIDIRCWHLVISANPVTAIMQFSKAACQPISPAIRHPDHPKVPSVWHSYQNNRPEQCILLHTCSIHAHHVWEPFHATVFCEVAFSDTFLLFKHLVPLTAIVKNALFTY